MTVFLISVFSVWTILWLTYWMLLRPYLMDSVRTDFYELKASLDWAIIENYPGSQSESAGELVKHLSHSTGIRAASLSPAIYFQFAHKAEINAQVARHRILINGSPDWLKKMWMQAAQLSMKSALTNSPFLWLPLALVLLAAVFSYKAAQWWKQTTEVATTLSCTQT